MPKKIFYLLILSRLIVFFVPYLIGLILGQNNFSWNRWDGPHYLYISEFGYTNYGDESNFIVFYPLYPLLIKGLGEILKNYYEASLVLSNLFFILGCGIFYKTVKLIGLKENAEKTIIALAFFPTSYFFSSPYPESLFLLLFSLAFYSYFQKKYLWAGVFAGLCVLTRPFGVLIAPSMLIENLLKRNKKYTDFVLLLVPSIIFGFLYLYINYKVFGDFLAFDKILQKNWYKSFSFPWEGILNSYRFAWGQYSREKVIVGWIEGVSTTVAFLIVPFLYRELKLKRLKTSWFVYYLLSVVMFSSTNFILSTPRYFLSIPPLFFILGKLMNKFIFLIFLVILIIFATIFSLGQWAF